MGHFNRDRGRSFGGNRSSGRREMHDAICSECGNECQIPFRPTGDRPVYCSSCFEQQNGGSSRRPERSDKRMFSSVCDECGNKCEVPFRPTSGKPVYCNNCFKKNDQSRGEPKAKNSDQYKAQFESINYKLDKIMAALNLTNAPKIEKEKPVKEKKKDKPKDIIKEKTVVKKPAKKTLRPVQSKKKK